MITKNSYIIAIEKSDADFDAVMQKIQNKPTDPVGYTYKLRADTLEWELVELPPVEPETLIDTNGTVIENKHLTTAWVESTEE